MTYDQALAELRGINEMPIGFPEHFCRHCGAVDRAIEVEMLVCPSCLSELVGRDAL